MLNGMTCKCGFMTFKSTAHLLCNKVFYMLVRNITRSIFIF